MPVTVLDSKSALVVIDLQKGMEGYSLLHPLADIVKRTNTLSTAFRAKGLPVVLVVVAGTAPGRTEQARRHVERSADFAELIAELDQRPDDIRITKNTSGAFAHTGLEDMLKALGVTQVVLTGVATGSGVDSTARQAYELGFNVTLVTDAMTDASLENHDHAIGKVFPRIGETGTTEDVLKLLKAAG